MPNSLTAFLTRLLVSPALLGLLFYLFATILLRRPPKKINLVYGYRTGRSMRTQETWDEGNRFSSFLMRRFGLFSILVGIVAALIVRNYMIMAIVTGVFSVGGAIILIFRTENHLKALFDDKGNRR